MKEILNMLITELVNEKDKVKIEEVNGAKEIRFNVSVADSDIGKVIGKQGKIARALRTVMKSLAAREGKKVYIEFKS